MRKRAASGRGAVHRTVTTPRKAVQAPLPQEEPAEFDGHSHAAAAAEAAAEAAEEASDMSQGDQEDDPFPVEPLQSPAKESAGNWKPYKKPKNVRSLDLDTICMSLAKKPKPAPMKEPDPPQ